MIHSRASAFDVCPKLWAAALIACALAGCDPEDPKEEAPPPPARASTKGGPRTEKGASLAEQARKLPPPPKHSPKGLEADAWTVEDNGNAAKAEQVDIKTKDGTRVRQAWDLKAGDKGFTSFRCDGIWILRSGKKAEAVLIMYNATPGAFRLSFAFSMGPRFAWHESPPKILKPGWNEIRIDQSAYDFKAARTEWRHRGALPTRRACRAVNIVIHSGARTGRIFLHSLTLATAKK